MVSDKMKISDNFKILPSRIDFIVCIGIYYRFLPKRLNSVRFSAKEGLKK